MTDWTLIYFERPLTKPKSAGRRNLLFLAGGESDGGGEVKQTLADHF